MKKAGNSGGFSKVRVTYPARVVAGERKRRLIVVVYIVPQSILAVLLWSIYIYIYIYVCIYIYIYIYIYNGNIWWHRVMSGHNLNHCLTEQQKIWPPVRPFGGKTIGFRRHRTPTLVTRIGHLWHLVTMFVPDSVGDLMISSIMAIAGRWKTLEKNSNTGDIGWK